MNSSTIIGTSTSTRLSARANVMCIGITASTAITTSKGIYGMSTTTITRRSTHTSTVAKINCLVFRQVTVRVRDKSSYHIVLPVPVPATVLLL